MWQKKIEKFADKILQNSTFNRPHLGSTFLNSKEHSFHVSKYKIATQTQIQENRRNFREVKKQMGLSKGDIDKLELMCADMNAEDYLNRLIKIHEEEKTMRNEVQIIVPDPGFYRTDRNRDQLSESSIQNKNSQRSISIESGRDKNENNSNLLKMEVTRQQKKRGSIFKQEQDKRLSKQKFKSNRKSFNNQLKKSNSKQKSCIPRRSSILKPSLCRIIQNQKKNQIGQKHTNQKYPLKKDSNHLGNIEKNIFSANRNLNNIPTINSGLNTAKSLQVKEPFSCQSEDISHEDSLSSESQPEIYEQCCNGNFYEEKDVSQAKKLEEMCYTEIGRRMVVVKQKQVRRQFFKTNLHIRSYIMKNILSYIEYLAQYSPTSIFILPNERALHFDPQTKPQQLSQHIEQTKYVEIIKNVNHIIQKNIFKQKYQKEDKSLWPYLMLIMFIALIVMMGLTVLVNGEGRTEENGAGQGHEHAGQDLLRNAIMIITGLLISVILVILIGYSLHLYSSKSNFIPVCDVIYADIGNYFKFLNGKMQNDLEWIVGESFFWLQVKIKKKQKEQEQSSVGLQTHRLKKTKRMYYKNEQDEVIQN